MSNRKRPRNRAQGPEMAAQAATGPVLPPDSVVIAYIHPGQTSAYFTQGLVNLAAYDRAFGGRHIVGVVNEWSSANVSQSRNNLTGRFLDEYAADWLLWVDSDMVFDDPATLERLVASADVDERPIMGALCFGSVMGELFPTLYRYARLDDGDVTTARVMDYPRDTVVQVAATGAAFLLIHRRVLSAMRDHGFNPSFPWFQETELGKQPCGEDITFCVRAGILGFPVHVDTSVKIGHHKTVVLDEPLFLTQRAMREADDGAAASSS